MFKSLLIANRGEIAVRVLRTARRMGLRTIAIYSDADARALHVALADEAVRIGPAPAAQSYLDIGAIIEAARRTGAAAIHPGYGFLSENAAFAEACEAAGVVFVGPPASAIRTMGLKDAAKRLMEAAGVPVVPGYHGESQDLYTLAREADKIGYPVLIKARAGGGGKGMRRVDDPTELADAVDSASREAQSSFGDGGVIIERLIAAPRHIEVQVFADAHGNAIHLFERDCSLQRRHQKVIEEAPAPGLSAEMRAAMGAAAVKAALAVGYRGAGTVEFIADATEGLRPDRFFFMEMNTRLQVEHPVTEAITGLDLVAWQLRVAARERFTRGQEAFAIRGHAIEARIYAEDPARDFAPAAGRLARLALPVRLARVDAGVREGDEVTPYYDPMIAKIIVRGRDRAAALAKLSRALAATRVRGVASNVEFLRALARHPDVVRGAVDTGLIGRELASLTAETPADGEALGLAALAACGLLGKRPEKEDPWVELASWRQWGAAERSLEIRAGEVVHRITVRSEGGGRHRVDGAAGSVDIAISGFDGHVVTYVCGGRTRRAEVEIEGALVLVHRDGETFVSRLVDDATAGDVAEAAEDTVAAPLPGLVKVVRVRGGHAVAKGDTLVVIEAMKMEHSLRAPRDGTVGEVMVTAGDIVQEGQVLVRLDDAAS